MHSHAFTTSLPLILDVYLTESRKNYFGEFLISYLQINTHLGIDDLYRTINLGFSNKAKEVIMKIDLVQINIISKNSHIVE